MRKPALIVICGPTGVGKTSLSLQLAREFKTEIISADSRQVYLELNIGTAKPDENILKKVKHHLINVASIQDDFSAGDFEREGLSILHKFFEKKDKAILCGGSGLYIRALLEGLDALPQVSDEILETLKYEFEIGGLEKLVQELVRKDPEYSDEVDLKNPHRVIRALGVIRSSGLPYSSFRTGIKKERNFEAIKIGLNKPRSELYEILNERVDAMVTAGLFEEASGLYEFRNKPALRTVGYQEIFDYMDGNLTKEQSIDLIKKNTRNYAKRQITWFKKDLEIAWFNPNQYDLILTHLKQRLTE